MSDPSRLGDRLAAWRWRLVAPVAALAGLLVLPGPTTAHQLVGHLDSPLPLAVYLGGAGLAVALSFAFVFARSVRWVEPAGGAILTIPGWLRAALRVAGVVALGWILAQTVIGGDSAADVPSLFLWVYTWAGLALVSALVGPLWSWLDPFTTLHDAGAWVLRRLGVGGWTPTPYPRRLGKWPAVAAYAFFVWLELVVTGGGGGSRVGISILAYTVLTLLGMAQYGRDAWRANGEAFSVWFDTLGRLAPFALVDRPESGRIRRRPVGGGLLSGDWPLARLVLLSIAVTGVLYDGLSQTRLWFDLFGLPGLGGGTILLVGFCGAGSAVFLGVARLVGGPGPDGGRRGIGALSAGLVPIATGYIAAHYLTFILIDGQRILVAVSDPFQQGWDLLGTAFFTPSGSWLPVSLVWTFQLVAVVGGHMLGAWFGHVAATRDRAGQARLRQVPLAGLMVVLTMTTLWSLGQAIFTPPTPAAARAPAEPVRLTAAHGLGDTQWRTLR